MLTRAFLIAILAALPAAANKAASYRLPAQAKITIGHSQSDPNDVSSSLDCLSFKLTEPHVRRMFATYHLLKDDDLHDLYDFPGCWIDGTVVLHEKTFTWQARSGNTLSTDWPDGVVKMLGGKHSETPGEDGWGQRYPLPSTAIVSIGSTQHDPKDSLSDGDFCKQYHLTERKVRKQFRTYHQLGPDGVSKELGGKYTDDMSEGESRHAK